MSILTNDPEHIISKHICIHTAHARIHAALPVTKQYSNKLFLVASELGKRQYWNGNGGEQKEHDEQEMEEMIRHSWYHVCAIKFSQQYSKRFHIAAISCHLRCSKHTNVTTIHSVLNTHNPHEM